jgi:hypothetical protein
MDAAAAEALAFSSTFVTGIWVLNMYGEECLVLPFEHMTMKMMLEPILNSASWG